jgi:hypothetical protein
MAFRGLMVIFLTFSLAAQAAKEDNCWELLAPAPQNKAATQEFIRLAKMAENIFGASLFSFKTYESAIALSSSQKAILFEWLDDNDNIGGHSLYSYEALADAISKLPRIKGIFFSKSPSFFRQIILERDIKEGDIVVVPAANGFSASKMTPESPIPFFARYAHEQGVDPTLFRGGPCLFVFGEARDFESVYYLQSHVENRIHEREVNFAPGTTFKVLKIIFSGDDSAGTFFLKQI